jgi:hypothetical protein
VPAPVPSPATWIIVPGVDLLRPHDPCEDYWELFGPEVVLAEYLRCLADFVAARACKPETCDTSDPCRLVYSEILADAELEANTNIGKLLLTSSTRPPAPKGKSARSASTCS